MDYQKKLLAAHVLELASKRVDAAIESRDMTAEAAADYRQVHFTTAVYTVLDELDFVETAMDEHQKEKGAAAPKSLQYLKIKGF